MSTGAMSYAFIEVMSRNPNQSYLSLLNEMRDFLANKYSQKPQLSVSTRDSTNEAPSNASALIRLIQT
jgi:hypothetical protein